MCEIIHKKYELFLLYIIKIDKILSYNQITHNKMGMSPSTPLISNNAHESHASDPAHVAQECIVCFDAPREWTFGLCGHKALCKNCCFELTECPACRSPDKKPIRVY